MIFGARIAQAREFKNLTQVELADTLGIAQSTLANFERDRDHPNEEMASGLARALKLPVEFFQRDVNPYFAVGTLEFRAKARLSAKLTKHAYQYGQIVFELATSLARRLTMPAMRLPRLEGDPEKAASILRSEFGLSPETAIPNLADTLERAGVFVFALPPICDGAFDRIDGFSVWAGDGAKLVPSIFTSAGIPGDRQRLTMAHEVGELALTDMPPGREREKKANRFAGALLMPAERFRDELVPPFSLDDFVNMKRIFGVSIQAAIVRAHHLGIIDPRRYHALFQQLSVKGWRKDEPAEFAISPEKPRALYKMVELLYGTPIDFTRLAKESSLDPWFIRQLLATHASRADLSGSSPSATVLDFSNHRHTSKGGNASSDDLKSM